MFKAMIRFAAVAAGMVALAGVSTSSARADFFDDLFGGPSSSYASGASRVRFPASYGPGQIVISFGDRRLYWTVGKGQAISYPIAIPKGEARWSGVLSVSQKRVNPDWTPTADMRRENPKLPAYVPGGHPRNPLGVRALYLGGTLYRIHGTDAPWLIGQEVSHGCIRMHNADVIDLYNRARIGTRVTVTWSRFGGTS
ncbi:MAG TPA: L,D-transpeptidase [Hyphomicrobiales bacterium]|jgi:lipoprotein-anchoring transpeptidase ErfK/SrfK